LLVISFRIIFVETDTVMKTLVTILFAIITVATYSQEVLSKYPLFSDIWKVNVVVENGKKVDVVTPINAKCFSLNTSYVEQTINETEIEKYLLESFNKFRKEYNALPVTQDAGITKGAEEYAKKLASSNTLVHDVNLPYGQSECIANISFMLLSKLTKEDGNINKIIADSYFDIFVGSDAHMDILLDNDTKTYGFGIAVLNNSIRVVVRGK
jgi:uncharacterized protein YkwD